MLEIVIDYNAHCKRCGRKGATPGGLCLRCVTALLPAFVARQPADPKSQIADP